MVVANTPKAMAVIIMVALVVRILGGLIKTQLLGTSMANINSLGVSD
jgi:hypothetical protein